MRNRQVRSLAWIIALLGLVSAACSTGEESTGTDTETTATTSAAADSSPRELRLLAWEGYDDPDWVEPFENQFNVEVSTTYVGSVDEMFAKLQTQGSNFDLVFPDSATLSRYIDAGLLQELDTSQLPNMGDMLEFWQQQTYYKVGDAVYAIPFTGGDTPIIYNTSAIDEPAATWGALWDPQYAGQIAMLDDSNNSVVIAALYLGLPDPFNLSDSEFEQVQDALREQRELVRRYYAGEDEGLSLFASSEATIGVQIEPFMVGELNEESEFVFASLYPVEGALAWVDNAAIPAGAANADIAHAYINYALTADVQGQLVSKYQFLPIVDVSQTADPEAAERVASLEDVIADLVLLQTPEDTERRVQVWNEIRAGG